MMVTLFALMAAAQATPVADPPKKDRIVCKRDSGMPTGSHMRSSTRVCLPQSEWDEMEKYTEDQLRKIDDRRKKMPERSGTGARGGLN